MNMLFWLIVSLLIVVALAIIIPPLWKKREIVEADSDQRNIKIAQERANDLKHQLDAGVLTQEQYAEQYAELELTLGDDLDIANITEGETTQGRWIIPIISVLLPIFSLLIYTLIGETEALYKQKNQSAQMVQNPNRQQIDVNAMVSSLAKKLEKDPDNGEGWVMLGRSYKHLKKYDLSVNAYEKAYSLLGDDPDVILQYADALAMANQGKLSGKPTELIYKALEIDNNNVTGLWLAGMVKAEAKDFASALTYWHKLEGILPPDSDSYKEIQNLIASVKARSNGQPMPVAESEQVNTSQAISITAQVSIDPSIQAIHSTDVVFIYAKAQTGPPMPLAIVRKKVADLPITVTLDDSMAMMPAMKLSNFKQVKVLARISKSGTAMPQAGDYVGSVDLNDLTKKSDVVIVINNEIK